MDYSSYALLKLSKQSSPMEILEKCKQYCQEWTLTTVQQKLSLQMSREEAAVCAVDVYEKGKAYLTSIATMLLDPSARQCYDAWLDVRKNNSPELAALTKARFQWFNSTSKNIRFSEFMLESLSHTKIVQPKAPPLRELSSKPVCRQCQCHFDFEKPYLVLHCDCTTRVGHVECIQDFATRVNNKCPVCRQKLLQRHQISKYLFWNVKEKFKFIA
tara:strand:- start:3623 stop:4267 length:645 start_codon:yes stop_codon:yes gene_type:complete